MSLSVQAIVAICVLVLCLAADGVFIAFMLGAFNNEPKPDPTPSPYTPQGSGDFDAFPCTNDLTSKDSTGHLCP